MVLAPRDSGASRMVPNTRVRRKSPMTVRGHRGVHGAAVPQRLLEPETLVGTAQNRDSQTHTQCHMMLLNDMMEAKK